jgi:hypothetical protein
MSIPSIEETLTVPEIVAVCLREQRKLITDAATRYRAGMDRWDVPPRLDLIADDLDAEADNAANEGLDRAATDLARHAATTLRNLAGLPRDRAISQRATALILDTAAEALADAIRRFDPALAVT